MKLSTRMKGYELSDTHYLKRRTPVIIRLDGKAFHTFTKGFTKPFDDILIDTMMETTRRLCAGIQCCKLGYTQSDEISLLLVDYDNIDTEPWFNNRQNKIESLSASICSVCFNVILAEKIKDIPELKDKSFTATFDSRAFNLPKEEVCNYFIWRQQDCTRNSIQSLGQANFSHKQLQNKSCNQIQDMLFTEKGINWNHIATKYKRGTCAVKITEGEFNGKWLTDDEIPIFIEDREYVDRFVYPKKEVKLL